MRSTGRPESRQERPYLDDLAELYDRFITAMDLAGNPGRDWLDAHLPGGSRAADIGCGNGRNCRLAADRYDEVVGIDISSNMLKLAEEKTNPSNVRYECLDALDISAAKIGLFDTVFVTNGVFMMGPIGQVLSRFRAVLAPGGTIVVLEVTRPDVAAGPTASGEVDTQQSFYPFEVAHTVYRASGDVDSAVAAIRYMLHPRWTEMSAEYVPLTLSEFHREYQKALPGARIHEDVVPTLSGAVWRDPGG